MNNMTYVLFLVFWVKEFQVWWKSVNKVIFYSLYGCCALLPLNLQLTEDTNFLPSMFPAAHA